jgi:hypothetical protein
MVKYPYNVYSKYFEIGDKMKKDDRDIIKKNFNIRESANQVSCKKCLYHTHQKICQIYLLKTRTSEVCDKFTPLRKHKVYLGGSLSPR